jgi:hypothetical protein
LPANARPVLLTVRYGANDAKQDPALCWSFIFGFLLHAEQPAPLVYVGATMVVAAGLILAFNERRRRLPPSAPPEPVTASASH